MSMKTNQLRTYWAPGDAELMINFLDDLRELLIETYGDEMIKMHQEMMSVENAEDASAGDNPMSMSFGHGVKF